MRIKSSDSALKTTASPSLRPAAVGQLTASTGVGGVSVALSSAVRTLAAAFAQVLPPDAGARVYDTLTSADRDLLTRALELASTEGIDVSEVSRLVLDLYLYRQRERSPFAAEPTRLAASQPGDAAPDLLQLPALAPVLAPTPSVASIPLGAAASASEPALALPSFSPQDEALARAILASSALQDTALDHGFVRALLDPDRTPTHAVSFVFLRRLVTAFAATPVRDVAEPRVSFARRDARAALAEALAELKLKIVELPRVSREVVQQGRELLAQRGWRPVAGERPSDEAAPRAAAPLRANERALLGLLYVAATRREIDLSIVDDVARALVSLRSAERAELPLTERALRPARPSLATTLSPKASHAAGAALPESEPYAEHPRADRPAEAAPATRSYGSATQIAASVARSYGSLAPAPLHGSALQGARESVTQLATTVARLAPVEGAAPAPLPTLTRPFNLSQALGLSALVGELRASALRGRRERLQAKRRSGIAAVTALPRSASEAEADDPLLDGARRRQRLRWQLLFQRRKRARKKR